MVVAPPMPDGAFVPSATFRCHAQPWTGDHPARTISTLRIGLFRSLITVPATGSAAPQCGAISQATSASRPADRPGRTGVRRSQSVGMKSDATRIEAPGLRPRKVRHAHPPRHEPDKIPIMTLEAIAAWGPRHGPVILLNQAANQQTEQVKPANLYRERSTLAHEICHLLIDRERALPVSEVLGGGAPEYAKISPEAQESRFVRRSPVPRPDRFAGTPMSIVLKAEPLVADADGLIRVGETRVTLDTVVAAF